MPFWRMEWTPWKSKIFYIVDKNVPIGFTLSVQENQPQNRSNKACFPFLERSVKKLTLLGKGELL